MIHIDLLSKLRSGIYLRSYAQVNPLQAYIDDAEKLFEHLQYQIAAQVMKSSLSIDDYRVMHSDKKNTTLTDADASYLQKLLSKLGG
jgi:preprotein translocase subunit SecA